MDRVAPYLADYMGWNVFEEIGAQWLRRHAQPRLNLNIQRMGRYWSRDRRIEIDIMAELEGGGFAPELIHLASDPQERLYLVAGEDLLSHGD